MNASKELVNKSKLKNSSPLRIDGHLTVRTWNCVNGSWKKPQPKACHDFKRFAETKTVSASVPVP